MGPDDAIERLKCLQQEGDPERAHEEADQVLCDFLDSMGYWEVVEEYHKVDPKWYA